MPNKPSGLTESGKALQSLFYALLRHSQHVTIGMKEILGARKLRLGVFRDWHRAVCRRAAYGEVTAAFPATLAQNHPDALLYVNANAAQTAY